MGSNNTSHARSQNENCLAHEKKSGKKNKKLNNLLLLLLSRAPPATGRRPTAASVHSGAPKMSFSSSSSIEVRPRRAPSSAGSAKSGESPAGSVHSAARADDGAVVALRADWRAMSVVHFVLVFHEAMGVGAEECLDGGVERALAAKVPAKAGVVAKLVKFCGGRLGRGDRVAELYEMVCVAAEGERVRAVVTDGGKGKGEVAGGVRLMAGARDSRGGRYVWVRGLEGCASGRVEIYREGEGRVVEGDELDRIAEGLEDGSREDFVCSGWVVEKRRKAGVRGEKVREAGERARERTAARERIAQGEVRIGGEVVSGEAFGRGRRSRKVMASYAEEEVSESESESEGEAGDDGEFEFSGAEDDDEDDAGSDVGEKEDDDTLKIEGRAKAVGLRRTRGTTPVKAEKDVVVLEEEDERNGTVSADEEVEMVEADESFGEKEENELNSEQKADVTEDSMDTEEGDLVIESGLAESEDSPAKADSCVTGKMADGESEIVATSQSDVPDAKIVHAKSRSEPDVDADPILFSQSDAPDDEDFVVD